MNTSTVDGMKPDVEKEEVGETVETMLELVHGRELTLVISPCEEEEMYDIEFVASGPHEQR